MYLVIHPSRCLWPGRAGLPSFLLEFAPDVFLWGV